jgi:hypothetical protein
MEALGGTIGSSNKGNELVNMRGQREKLQSEKAKLATELSRIQNLLKL